MNTEAALRVAVTGKRLNPPCLPGFDTLGPLKEILKTGYDYSWFVLSQKVIEKEFALSGSEQNPDLTSGKWIEVIKARLLSRGGAPGPDEAFKTHGADFVVADTPEGTFLGGCIFSGRNAGRSKAIA